jgi:hypothetical protein
MFRKPFVFVFLLFAFVLNSFAQDKSNLTTLKNILIAIEQQHQINFNYTENNVANIKLQAPDLSLSLEEKIKYLEKKTDLSFENIDKNIINIFKIKIHNKTNIFGYVSSNIDHKAIENANIQFLNSDRITTNSEGYFEFKKAKKKEFWISHIGYITQKITIADISDENCLNIILEPEITELQEIKAFSILTSGISKNTDGSFEIKAKKFSILPGLIEPDILQTMQQIPGINSIDESVASINVRGGTHDQNLFLWNGIRIYQTGHFFGLISVFNPNLPHTISIYKNGSSALYGESVSSVVNISSTPETFEKNTFSAGINMINADAFLKYNLSKNSYIEISGRKSITDYLETPTYNEYFNKAFQNTSITDFIQSQNINYQSNKKFGFYDATIKYALKIGSKDQLILDLITINDKLHVFQSATTETTSQSEKNSLTQTNFGGNLLWKRNWNTSNTTTINIHSSNYKLLANKNSTSGNQIIIQENKVHDNGITIENNHILSPKFTLNNGYQLNDIGVSNLDKVNSPHFYRNQKEVLRTHALIVEGKFQDSVSRINLNTGFRLNYIEKFKKTILEPRLQFNYGINTNFNLEILGELKSQNTQQSIDLQQDYFGIEKRHWIISNDSTVPIQRSKQVSISLSFNKNNWFVSVENFYKKVTGITSSSQGFQNQLEFIKINGKYEVVGTEILIQKKINHFLTWLSYAYNNNNYHFPTYEYPYFPNNFEMDHNFSWAGVYEQNNFKLALGAKWSSGRPETTPSSKEINASNPVIVYNKPNNQEQNPYFQINFSSTYNWKSYKGARYKLGLSVLNILNNKNEISEYYRISSLTNTIEEVKTFSLQRTPNLSFRVNF